MSDPFDPFSKALTHYSKLQAIARGDYPPPVSVKIELTNFCNHHCHFCAYRKIVQDSKMNDFLKTDRVLSLIDELAKGGVKALMFTGGGEPLLHPDLELILSRVRERGLEQGLITNGSRLNRLSDDALSGLRWIRFSINAGTDAGYAQVHDADQKSWENVWAQVKRVADKTKFPHLVLGISFVVTSLNEDQLEEAVRKAKEYAADYIHFRPAFQGPHTELEKQLSKTQVLKNLETLNRIQHYETAQFKIYGIRRRFLEIEDPPYEHIHCRSTPLISYILPNGDVSICTLIRSLDFNPKVPDPFLGNIYRSSFFELWNSSKHRDKIRDLSESGCRRCHFSEHNRALALVEKDLLHRNFL